MARPGTLESGRKKDKAAAKLGEERIEVNKLGITTREIISKYDVLMSPALAINGVVRIVVKLPDVSVIEWLLRKAI